MKLYGTGMVGEVDDFGVLEGPGMTHNTVYIVVRLLDEYPEDSI